MILCAAAVLCAQACSTQEKAADPALEALKAAVAAKVGGDAKVTFTAFEKVDSTTFGQEFEHRKKVFDLKLEQDLKLYGEYRSKGMSVNEAKKKEAVASDKRIIKGMEAIGEAVAACADSVAYYDYRFSGKAVTGSGNTVFQDYWACITPACEVLCFQPEKKGLHNAMGRVLPGYSELISGGED